VFYTFAIGPEQLAKSKFENNLYYCGAVDKGSTPKFLQTMRAHGVAGTDAYADPRFSVLKPGEFQLAPDSPALSMGIKQIDLRSVGLTSEYPKRLLQ
jgi:hypothetical protein